MHATASAFRPEQRKLRRRANEPNGLDPEGRTTT